MPALPVMNAPWLLAIELKGALLLGGAALVALALRRAAAAARHWVWSVAVTLLLILPGLVITFAAVAGRVLLLREVTRVYDLPPPDYRLVPARDLLSFAIFIWSFFGRSVRWRGHRHQARPGQVVHGLAGLGWVGGHGRVAGPVAAGGRAGEHDTGDAGRVQQRREGQHRAGEAIRRDLVGQVHGQ